VACTLEGVNVFSESVRLDRRVFLRAASGACISQALSPVFAAAHSSPLRLGVVVWVRQGQPIGEAIQGVRALGLETCQVGFEQLTPEVAGPLKEALAKHGVEATAFSEHGPGKRVFDFYNGPGTIGIVPPATRQARIRNLKLAADIALACGIPAIHTHCGFIPEDPNDPLYAEAVAAMKEITSHCKEQGRSFLCETGEETPVTLLRMIQDVGLDNLFVNLDLANLIMYGKGDPVDALNVFGHLVRGVHAKDGLLPTDTKNLGKEVVMGTGRVDFPAVFERLKRVKYRGPVIIEHETAGAEHEQEILRSKIFLEELISKTYDASTTA
jgi:L-ribulose-5-phosphate 3-epimerase